MIKLPPYNIPITEISLEENVRLFIKREDLIHPFVSGNKYWKLFYNIENYLQQNIEKPLIITFGGAFSNHISAVSYLGKQLNIKTIGIIRGEELQNNFSGNPTLKFASENRMQLVFVSRGDYRDKEMLKEHFLELNSEALFIEEGGTNDLAVKGIQHMINEQTKEFDYLCTAIGTGGTIAGISRFAAQNQKIIGFEIVKDDSLENKIFELSGKKNFKLIKATEKYGKITDENVRFINWFYANYQIPLDPIYTGKMMMKIFSLIKEGYFPENSRILAFHTGGLQGILGANQMLKKQNRTIIQYQPQIF